MKTVDRKENTQRRHKRLRQQVVGTAERPRLCVAVTNKHIYVQLVDDERAMTLAATCTGPADGKSGKNVAAARLVGQRAATLAKEKGITAVVFDRGGRKYHGRVKAVADAVREAGIKF